MIYDKSFFHFLISSKNNSFASVMIDFGLKLNTTLNKKSQNNFIEEGYININKGIFNFSLGRFYQDITSESKSLSSGALSISNNANPIPRIDFGVKEFSSISFSKFNFQLKGGFSHGWFNKGEYTKAPFLHQKNIYLKKKIYPDQSLMLGIVHIAMWGGATRIHGNQPQKASDFLRIFFLQPASSKGIKQERVNTLGNHLGIWDLAYEKEINHKKLKLYYQHPFEDESGSRWLSNRFDGLYGVGVFSDKMGLINQFLYEYINTMNQSGPQGASDSTYGWDNYYNHYIYQSGWTYNNKVIGNPLFTLGSNKGSYSDGTYIVNNRIKAHHIGIIGNLSKKIHYTILFTHSKNYGIFPDEEKFKKGNKSYRYENGLIQQSGIIQIRFNNFIKKLNAEVSYGIDQGQHLVPAKALIFSINYNYSMVSASK